MTPRTARLKRFVREAIERCGGIDGAAATADRRRSVAGDWNNLNCAALPPLECALALDEVALAAGTAPPIVSAYARELGGVFIALGEASGGTAGVTDRLIELAEDLGALARDGRLAMADGVIDPAEAAKLRRDLMALIGCATVFDRELQKIEDGGQR